MGGLGAGGGRRRWPQRSCRAGGGGVVRRAMGAPVPEERSAGAAQRPTGGSSLVDKQQRVHEVLSVSRSSSRSTSEKDYLSSDFRQFKCKGSSDDSKGCLPSELIKNEKGCYHSMPTVMAGLMDFDAANEVLTACQKTSFSWPRDNLIPRNGNLFHVSSNVSGYGLSYQPKFHFREDTSNNNVKLPQPLKNSSGLSYFSYRLAKSAGRSDSMKISQASANCSLSERMSLLRQRCHGRGYENLNCIGAKNWRHKIVYSGGASNIFTKEEVHNQSDSSAGRHCQVLLDNALVRQNQLYCSQPLYEESGGQSWISTNSESEKVVCFSSGFSSDDLQALLSSDTSDTSDNSKLSSLGTIVSDQWKMTFKKVHCPAAARIKSISVTNRKEIEQPSPVSVLEPPVEDFSYGENIRLDLAHPHDSQLRLEPVKFPCVETAAQLGGVDGISDYLCFELVDTKKDETIQLVEDILEEFGDEEERDFSYLLDILIVSGIHGTEEEQLYKVCQSLDCPAGYDVFEKLENKYMRVSQWSRSDRKLIFDMVNSILSEILAPCLDMHPWVNAAKNVAPMWGSDGLLEKVLQMLAQRREELVLCKPKPEKKAFDKKWPDLADCIDKAGKEVEKMVTDDLLEELFLELMSS